MELIAAGALQRPILENLLQLYMHDFSELIALDIGEDGRYIYRDLPRYWSEAFRWPFLARYDGKLVGFALIKTANDGDRYDMAEFFVMRSYRHRGLGTELAEKVWRHFPGPWQIRVMEKNVAACRFWMSSIARFTNGAADFTTLEIDGTTWRYFAFDSTSK
jgi:predicted acetyltransferase